MESAEEVGVGNGTGMGNPCGQNAGGYGNAPGIYTDAHMNGWKMVKQFAARALSFSYNSGHSVVPQKQSVLAKENNSPYVSPSPIPFREEQKCHARSPRMKLKSVLPLHGANGCLIDQFIQDVTNQRTDEYGASIENRARFILEVIDTAVEAVGAERTGFRISPWGVYSGMGMVDPKPQFSYVVEQLRKHKLAYIHVVEPIPAEITAEEDSDFLRDIWQGPDLPIRLLKDIALGRGDQAT
ncbi:uncharacterized protein BJ212DRAFT_1579298 [Suillus subaureus]|uniref:NADH:flavin oxidoreductase/NADH oxidase N-terminal domain-containing protein n=1 Tax=Suillus subaureus TaxID=48587 RepID=A0A9P7JAB0_9AGAM|nr:uncharacterized protein BJ212DRAFT_1579298 [Suillus subaureus]KAG1811291.1 hypothetical protein BJ212DRAFT_1579298 [Suillus subaureus]